MLKILCAPVRFAPLMLLCCVVGGALLAPVVARGETVRLGGTGSALGTMKLMADGYRALDPTFALQIVPNLGSSGGIKALTMGAIDIAVTSRPPKATEDASGLKTTEYARTPFVLATTESSVRDLTLNQIADLYSGKQSRWSNGRPVRLVLRPAADSDTILLASFSPEVKDALAIAMAREGMIKAMTDQDAVDNIERLPGAIGTSTLALLRSEHRRAVPLSINGVEPSVTNVVNGRYPYTKHLYTIVNGNPSAPVAKFLAFLTSDAGRRILAQNGHAEPE